MVENPEKKLVRAVVTVNAVSLTLASTIAYFFSLFKGIVSFAVFIILLPSIYILLESKEN